MGYSMQMLPELIRTAHLLTSFCSSSTIGEGEGGVDFLAGRESQKREQNQGGCKDQGLHLAIERHKKAWCNPEAVWHGLHSTLKWLLDTLLGLTYLYYCKNIWTEGLSCIRVTKECYQIGFLEDSMHWRASFLFQKTYLATFLAFLYPMIIHQGAIPGQMLRSKQTTNLTRNAFEIRY